MTISNLSRESTYTVEILVGDTGFSRPSPPPALNLQSTMWGIVNPNNGGGTISYVSCFAPSAPLLEVACSPATPGMVSTPPVGQDLRVTGDFSVGSSAVVSASVSGVYTVAEDLTVMLNPMSSVTLGTSTNAGP
jgi:hypothetical protein